MWRVMTRGSSPGTRNDCQRSTGKYTRQRHISNSAFDHVLKQSKLYDPEATPTIIEDHWNLAIQAWNAEGEKYI